MELRFSGDEFSRLDELSPALLESSGEAAPGRVWPGSDASQPCLALPAITASCPADS